MKNLIILMLVWTASPLSFAATSEQCLVEANKIAEEAFYSFVDNIPNATSIEGMTPIINSIKNTKNEIRFATSGNYYFYISTVSYDSVVTIEISLDQTCHLTSNPKLTEKIFNFRSDDDGEVIESNNTAQQDQNSNGESCHQEIALQCNDGYIDRCLKETTAKTHLCVKE